MRQATVGSAKSAWQWRLLRRARPQAGSLGLLLLLSFTGIAFNLFKPWPLKIIVDFVLPAKALPPELIWLTALPGTETSLGLLAWLTASTVVTFLLGWVNNVLAHYVQIDTAGRLTYGFAAEAFSHLQRLTLRFHNRWPTGDLVKRVAVDCQCVRALVIDVCVPAITSFVTLLAIFAIIWRLDPSLATLALAVVPPLAILLHLYAKPMLDREYEQAELQGDIMAHAEQVLTGLPIIQAFGREAAEGERFVATTNRVGESYLRNISIGLQFRILTGVTLAVGTALLVSIGGRHVLTNSIQLGDLLVLLSYVAYFYSPLETLAYLSMSYASAAAGARRVFELTESKERIVEAPDAEVMPVPAAGSGIAVELKDVDFAYEQGSDVLRRVSFSAAPGQTIALVGPTGAGKTTIVSLILRLFDPNQGSITFDGVDIRKYQVSSLRETVAIVLQDAFLLPMTVADNIAYARPNAPRKDVVAAARAAHAEEFIEKLPQGYDTVIGERGATLSGGQRQRLAIARAFLKDAPILILDEPTSALDTQTEALVLEATYRLMKGRTTFIIGHRLSTVKHADRIVVLDHGKVVETGTHQELVAAQGLYDRLYSIQFQEPAPLGRMPL